MGHDAPTCEDDPWNIYPLVVTNIATESMEAMALIEIDALPNLKMVDLSVAVSHNQMDSHFDIGFKGNFLRPKLCHWNRLERMCPLTGSHRQCC